MSERILITGGAGFIGSHLAESLLADGATVSIIDNLSTGNLENVRAFSKHPRFRFVAADIRDEAVLDRMVSEADSIFHLAAAVGVQLIVQNPVQAIETNIMGTESVVKAARRHGCKLLITTTSEIYGKGIRTPFAEEDDIVLGATYKSRWAYAATKMVDEFLALAYHQQYGLPVILVRLFNTIGPRQTGQYGMVVPRFVAQALAHEEMTVYGDGRQSRCFCDVRDVIVALKGLFGAEGAIGKVFNVGSQEEITIRGLAERIRLLLASESSIVSVPYAEAYGPGFEDMERRVPDTTRVQRLIGWQARTRLDETVHRVAESMSVCPSEA